MNHRNDIWFPILSVMLELLRAKSRCHRIPIIKMINKNSNTGNMSYWHWIGRLITANVQQDGKLLTALFISKLGYHMHIVHPESHATNYQKHILHFISGATGWLPWVDSTGQSRVSVDFLLPVSHSIQVCDYIKVLHQMKKYYLRITALLQSKSDMTSTNRNDRSISISALLPLP